MNESIRIQKYLSQCGVASRRQAEAMIREGRIAVNGAVVREMGRKIDPAHDRVEVDGQPVREAGHPVYYAYNKPRGLVVTFSDERGRRTVFEDLPPEIGRVVAVGRLDKDSEGLLLLTNDGNWANRIAHPSSEIEKEYQVLVSGSVPDKALKRMMDGVDVGRGETLRVAVAERIAAHNRQTLLRIVLREGRNRHIRRMMEALNFKIASLMRVRIGPVELRRLKPRRVRKLTKPELTAIEKELRNKG